MFEVRFQAELPILTAIHITSSGRAEVVSALVSQLGAQYTKWKQVLVLHLMSYKYGTET